MDWPDVLLELHEKIGQVSSTSEGIATKLHWRERKGLWLQVVQYYWNQNPAITLPWLQCLFENPNAAILIFNLKTGCKFSMGCAAPQQRWEFLISHFIIRQFPFITLTRSLCFHHTLSKMWKQDIWNFSEHSSRVCLMDTSPSAALLSSDLPFQSTSAALGISGSCLEACNNSERFLPTNPSIRNFS